MKITAIGNKLVLKTIKVEELSAGGIYIPKAEAHEKNGATEGIVLSIGVLAADILEDSVKIGDKVIIGKHAGVNKEEELEDGTIQVYKLIEHQDIYGVIAQ